MLPSMTLLFSFRNRVYFDRQLCLDILDWKPEAGLLSSTGYLIGDQRVHADGRAHAVKLCAELRALPDLLPA